MYVMNLLKKKLKKGHPRAEDAEGDTNFVNASPVATPMAASLEGNEITISKASRRAYLA